MGTTIGLVLFCIGMRAYILFLSISLSLLHAPSSNRKRKGMNYRTHQFRLFLVYLTGILVARYSCDVPSRLLV
ncbi:hypothetical protein GHT06_022393 [Daphnia sinensis]|uniref:Uncharacterized protein n=1 Tax=Daphnia sinensis TaxID=1820382 RepID=A0AAD5KXS3_9CRUS|nr:hypothetical protein GHT06_022393 [Daphnia sinensis]